MRLARKRPRSDAFEVVVTSMLDINFLLIMFFMMTAQYQKETRAELLSALAGLEAEAPPFSPAPPRSVLRDTIWVRPELVVRAEFAGWTGDGLVRQASYKGIDRGKDPRKVIRERPR